MINHFDYRIHMLWLSQEPKAQIEIPEKSDRAVQNSGSKLNSKVCSVNLRVYHPRIEIEFEFQYCSTANSVQII